MLQGLAIQKLHDDKGLARVLAYFVDGADIRVIQGGRGLCLAAESLQCLTILRQIFG
jgi:hypothetical protein